MHSDSRGYGHAPIAPDAIAETALRFILSAGAVSTVIPGMRSIRNVPPAQVEKLHAHRWARDFYR